MVNTFLMYRYALHCMYAGQRLLLSLHLKVLKCVTISYCYFYILVEFRQQLIRLETLTERIPPLVIKDIVEASQSEYETQREKLERDFEMKMKQIDNKRVCLSVTYMSLILLHDKHYMICYDQA